MVSLTINLDDETVKLLKEEARHRGITVDELIALGARIVVDTTTSHQLTDAEESELEEADAEIDRGEFVTTDELFAKLRALRG